MANKEKHKKQNVIFEKRTPVQKGSTRKKVLRRAHRGRSGANDLCKDIR